jgi:hypothetical protein
MQRVSRIAAIPILVGLHHQYVRVQVLTKHKWLHGSGRAYQCPQTLEGMKYRITPCRRETGKSVSIQLIDDCRYPAFVLNHTDDIGDVGDVSCVAHI